MAGLSGLPQGEGLGLSARIVDDEATAPSRASMDQSKDTPASANWFRALCARYSMSKKSSRTRCATTWNAATPSSKPRWRKFCASIARSRSLKRQRSPRRRSRATRLRSFPMTRNPAFRRSPRPPRICRPSPARTRPSRAIMNISATARSACWRASTCSPVRSAPSSKTATEAGEFIEFLKLLDAAYPSRTAIKLILDNHSAHISKETKAWLAEQPVGRFEFTFTPKHGSWLNLVEGFFSKLARSVLRHIRVASKQELKDRIMAAMLTEFNRHPVVHPCPVPISSTTPLDMIRILETMN